MNDYTKKTIADIKREAKGLKDDVISVRHIHPRAYCVAKPAPWCAVFVVPPCDNEPQVANNESVSIHNDSVANVRVGDWCALAYLSTKSCGEPHVVRIL